MAVSLCLLAMLAGQDGKAIACAIIALCFMQIDDDDTEGTAA